MKNGGVILIFVLILLIGGGVLVYFLFERPIKDNNGIFSYSNVSIYAVDVETDKIIKTNYIIYMNNISYKEGGLESGGAILVKVPYNNTIEIMNNNTEKQDYYIDKHIFYNNETIRRVELKLIRPGTPIFQKINNSYIQITSEGILDDIKFCFKWFGHIIYVKSPFEQIQRIENWDKCYYANVTLNNGDKLNIPIDYKTFGDDGDYDIQIGIIDSNLNNHTYQI